MKQPLEGGRRREAPARHLGSLARLAPHPLILMDEPFDGSKVAGYLDGKLSLEHTLPELVSGRIGLWSKADSCMYSTR